MQSKEGEIRAMFISIGKHIGEWNDNIAGHG